MGSIRSAGFALLRLFVRAFRPALDAVVGRGNPSQAPVRVAVLLDSGIGDTLMATPMLRALRRQLPAAAILAVVDRATAQVMARNPDVDGLCVFRHSGDAGKMIWAGLRALRRFRPQVMLAPQTANTLKQILAAYYSGAPVRVKHAFDYPPGRRYSDFEFLFTHRPPVEAGRHRVLDNLALLGALGLNPDLPDAALVFPIPAWSASKVQALLEEKNWTRGRPSVCIHPGVGTATLQKQWPPERFVELGRRLAADHGVQIVLVGGKEEAALCGDIAKGIGSNCVVVAGECTLVETGAVIRLCQWFVSNDSGLMHLASAVGASGVALFGPTNPAKVGPYGGALQVVQASAIEELSVDAVYNKCAAMSLPAFEGRHA